MPENFIGPAPKTVYAAHTTVEAALAAPTGSAAPSLRDMFAAQAISLFPLSEGDLRALENGVRPDHKLVSKFCYELADAMMAERQNDADQQQPPKT